MKIGAVATLQGATYDPPVSTSSTFLRPPSSVLPQPSVSFLIPAFNEEQALSATIDRVLRVVNDNDWEAWELILLDDHSSDRTFQVMQHYASRDPARIRLYHHEMNCGIAKSFEELYRLARNDAVFLISGDGEYPPEAILRCLPLMQHADMVICRRTSKHYTPYRRVVSSGYRLLPLFLFGLDLVDPGSIKCVSRHLLMDIPVTSKGVFAEAERMIRALKRGYRMEVIDVAHQKRDAGAAQGARFSLVWQALLDAGSLWWKCTVRRQQL